MNDGREIAFSELSKAMSLFTKISPLTYWLDLVCSAVFGWLSLLVATYSENSILAGLSFLTAAVLLYRGTVFIHEVIHVQNKIPYFRQAYDLLIGYANCYPSYTYEPHFFHHLTRCYGTHEDPEFNSHIGRHRLRVLLSPILLSILLPFYQTCRFVFLPLFYPVLTNKKKTFIFQRLSTLVFNADYKRSLPDENDLRIMRRNDFACASIRLSVFALTIADVLPVKFVILWFSAIALGSLMNMYRALANHDYLRPFGRRTRQEQFLQSKTLTPRLINEIWAPLSMGYHALHHLSPSIPYHELPRAHRYIMKNPRLSELYAETLQH
jgi:fatty acid desaturase